MVVKDYYQILNLPPSATIKDIKRNFRKLAKEFHPDMVKGGTLSTNAWYAEIQEAYEVLTTPRLRSAYLKERWLAKTEGQSLRKVTPISPMEILVASEKLKDFIRLSDHYRMDHAGLSRKIQALLQHEQLTVLREANNRAANKGILENLIAATRPIDYIFLPPVFSGLHQLASLGTAMEDILATYERQRKIAYRWERYQTVVIALITVLLCMVIYCWG